MRVDARAMAPGETAAVALDEPVTLHSDDQPAETRASGAVQVQRTNRGVTVRGQVRALMSLVCSRCLLPFQAALTADVDEEFSFDPAGDRAVGELAPEAFVSWLGPGHEVDMGEIARQHLQMSVPMAPVHAEDCRGLCPVCGTNWNERGCEHQTQLRD